MSGTHPFLPAAILFAVAIVLASLRSRRVSTKLAAEIVAMLAIMLVLLDRGTSPLPMWKPLTGRPDAAWLRALAVAWWLIGARVVATGAALLLGRDTRSRQARLFSDLVTGAIYLSAAYVIADSILDLPVRTLIATSGVVAVVLGLALQNTLADLFSGIAVEIEQPFGVGDTLSVDANLSGVVIDMTWRSVRLRTQGGDVATIPNSAIAKASVTNHSRPSERRAASLDIPIRSQASARRLIELLRQSLMLCPDVLETPEPAIRIKALDRFGPCFTITYHVASSERLEEAHGQILRQARRLLRHAGFLPGPAFDTRALLRDVSLFEDLTCEALDAIEAELSRRRFEPGRPW